MAEQKQGSALAKHTLQFRQKAEDLGEDVQQLGKIGRSIAEDAVSFLGENATEYYQQGIDKVRDLENSFEKKIGRRPLQALGIAAAVGLVFGFLWRGRR